MTCLFSVCKKKRSFPARNTADIENDFSAIRSTYTYNELRMATKNFSPGNKIGKGGFGTVYKGTLKNGTVAAIKVLSADSRQGLREFLTEIKVISDIKHENLVKLYGFCAEGNHRILIYGYLENNSLARTLLDGRRSGIQFTWAIRCKICIGVAQGLAFIHEEVQPHIVHRDIKASNILLDKDLTPKISDFGLAKLFPDSQTHISTRVAGTTGYLAPEYAIRGQLTRKADIYSFGVLLLEIVSGRPNADWRLPPEEHYLLERVWECHEKDELLTLVDTSLNGDYNVEEACRYLKIGLLCTQKMPKRRPSMSMVVQMLMGKVDVNDQDISKPGLLPELMGLGGCRGWKGKSKMRNSSDAISECSGKLEDSSSLQGWPTSYATLTFNSIYDRSS